MRLVSWIFVVAAAVTALGVFLPVLEVAGRVISKRETLSLHGAADNRAMVRKVLGAYRKHEAMRHVVGKITPHTGGRVKDYLEDADDAMDTLSGISDDDAKQAGRALWILTWFVIGLAAVMIALVFFDVVSGVYHRGRIIGALVLAVVLCTVTITRANRMWDGRLRGQRRDRERGRPARNRDDRDADRFDDSVGLLDRAVGAPRAFAACAIRCVIRFAAVDDAAYRLMFEASPRPMVLADRGDGRGDRREPQPGARSSVGVKPS